MTMSESAVQQRVRLCAAYNAIELWRNNSGACLDQTGRLIRYGLGNDSAALNKRIKSSDLIGVMPGGQFIAVECKPEGWHLTPGDERGQAQARYHEIVRKSGGRAGFVTSEADFRLLAGLPPA